jgi:hypothetical protein
MDCVADARSLPSLATGASPLPAWEHEVLKAVG